jgi:hypothetical protein
MTENQLRHAIDCAYDCDEPELAGRLEAELRVRFPFVPLFATEPVTPIYDPLADTSKLFEKR